jgi:hypothetical protein
MNTSTGKSEAEGKTGGVTSSTVTDGSPEASAVYPQLIALLEQVNKKVL